VSVRRRAGFAVTALVAWVAGSALGTLGSFQPASAQVGVVIGKAHAGYAPSLTGSTPIVILVVGSGARLGDDVTHSLADSIHVVSINPDKHKATMIGIPRDSWVDIPGNGNSKINASMVDGGPDLLVQTVESISGLRIDYYALTTFWGVSQLYDNLGGLTMDVPFSMHDSYSGADFEPGLQTLDGDQVLAFSRDRHSLSGGDFARSENAGRVLTASLGQFRKEFQSDQSALFAWIASGMRNVETSVPFDEVMALAYTCSHINPHGATNIVLPGSTGFEGSLSVVHLSSEKDAIFADVKPDGLVSKKNIPPSPTANET
jgi:LCP family protein required for cell wall assembly